MGRRIAKAIFLVALVVSGPAVAVFDDIYEYQGIVGTVDPTYFTILGSGNTVVRVLLKPDQRLPRDIMAGVRVRAVLEKVDGRFYLREVTRLDTALPPPVPAR